MYKDETEIKNTI